MPQFTTENVCYVKHGERQIMARVFKPEGAGPFPCYIDLHGGAWNNGSRPSPGYRYAVIFALALPSCARYLTDRDHARLAAGPSGHPREGQKQCLNSPPRTSVT